jgi:transposase-like protein
VPRFTPLLIDAARPCRHSVGDRWFVDETYVKVAGVWRYVYRAVDQYGQVIDVYVSKRRNLTAASTFFTVVLANHERPEEVTTDLAPSLLRVVDELLSDVLHDTEQYSNRRPRKILNMKTPAELMLKLLSPHNATTVRNERVATTA